MNKTLETTRLVCRSEGLVTAPSAATASATATAVAPATATAATTISKTAATAATAARTFGLGTGFIHVQRASFQVLLVHAIDGCLGFRLGRHLDEPEATRLATELVFKNGGLADLSEGTEGRPQILFSDIA